MKNQIHFLIAGILSCVVYVLGCLAIASVCLVPIIMLILNPSIIDTFWKGVVVLIFFIIGISAFYGYIRLAVSYLSALKKDLEHKRAKKSGNKTAKTTKKAVSVIHKILTFVLPVAVGVFAMNKFFSIMPRQGYDLTMEKIFLFSLAVFGFTAPLIDILASRKNSRPEVVKKKKSFPPLDLQTKYQTNVTIKPPVTHISMSSLLEAERRQLTDTELSEKVKQIQTLIEEISTNIDLYPANAASINKFNSYYMPTMINLIKTYSALEKSTISLEGEEQVKSSIKGAMDNICSGFEKLSNNMFDATEMNVSAEIDALNSILASDGLLVKDQLEI